MRLMMLAAACGLLIGVPAIAQDSGQTPASATPAPEKKTCRYYTTTGSIMPGKRTCHTASEWKDIDAQNRANTDRMNHGNGIGHGMPGSDNSNPG